MKRRKTTETRLLMASLGGLLLACNSSTTLTPGTVFATAVVVVPQDFLGKLPCSTDTGAMQTYRATLVDVTDGLEAESPEVTSTVIPCKDAAYFENVVVGNRYIAKIQGYPRNDLSVDPDSGATVDPDRAPVTATWTTTCYGYEIPEGTGLGGADALGGAAPLETGGAGGAEGVGIGVYAYSQARNYVRACLPLTSSSPTGETGTVIGIQASLGTLACGDEPGTVSTFSVLVEGATDADGETSGSGGSGGDDWTAACADTVTVPGLVDGENYTFDVVAFEPDADEPSWGTSCRVTARAGVLATASCEVLKPLG